MFIRLKATLGCLFARSDKKGWLFGTVPFIFACAGSDGSGAAQSASGTGLNSSTAAWSLGAAVAVEAQHTSHDTSGFAGVIGAVRTRSGMAIGAARRISFYDSTGRLLKQVVATQDTLGGASWLGRCAGTGSIALQEFRRGTLTFLSDSGVVTRTMTLPRGLKRDRPMYCRADGAIAVIHTLPDQFSKAGITTVPVRLIRILADGNTEGDVLPANAEYYYSTRGKSYVEQPLGQQAVIAALGDEIVVGQSDRASIDIVDFAGRARGRIVAPLQPRVATASDLLEAVTLRIYEEASPSTRDVLRATIIQTPLRAAEVAYDAAVPDRLGNLWLRTFEMPRRDSVLWRVIDRTGRTVATSVLPVNLYVTEVGADYVLGIQRGVGTRERVALYALLKGKR